MGFEAGRTFRLEWPETHFLHGALIRMRSAPLGVSIRIRASMPWTELVEVMCAHVVEWDLEYDGRPLPRLPEEVMNHLDRPVLVAICSAWQDASAGVTAPLDSASSDGQPSPDTDVSEQSIPME